MDVFLCQPLPFKLIFYSGVVGFTGLIITFDKTIRRSHLAWWMIEWISSSRFVSSSGLSNLRAGSLAQGLDSHASRTEQNFPKILLGKGRNAFPYKIRSSSFFYFRKKGRHIGILAFSFERFENGLEGWSCNAASVIVDCKVITYRNL